MKTNEELLEAGKVFLSLSDEIDEELTRTGFDPKGEPSGAEPKLPERISELTETQVKDLYDTFLSFYVYLSDRITNISVYLGVTQKAADVVEAQIVLEAGKNKEELHNAELRKAHVIAHPALIHAQKDAVYFKQLKTAQEHRLKKISKSMDRLYRELMIRQPRWSAGDNKGGEQDRPRKRHAFKPVRT